jgi:hypothetical protein
MRLMTDVSAERFWTGRRRDRSGRASRRLPRSSRKSMEIKEIQEIMHGYHDLVDHGRREIYTLEN